MGKKKWVRGRKENTKEKTLGIYSKNTQTDTRVHVKILPKSCLVQPSGSRRQNKADKTWTSGITNILPDDQVQ